MKKKSNWIWIVVVVIVIGGLVALLVGQANKPGKYDALAQCISDSGAQFYGAFWCPHCQAQKAMFGKSAHLLPYIECSQPSGNGQLPVCDAAGIKGYPTWRLADGTPIPSESEAGVSLQTLAARTGCTAQLSAAGDDTSATTQPAAGSATTSPAQ